METTPLDLARHSSDDVAPHVASPEHAQKIRSLRQGCSQRCHHLLIWAADASEEAIFWHVEAQMSAQRRGGIVLAKQTSALQLWHNLINETIECPGKPSG